MSDGSFVNTDRELWREPKVDGSPGDYYSPKIHVTLEGSIGINVGGTVIVMPLRHWHSAAAALLAERGLSQRLREQGSMWEGLALERGQCIASLEAAREQDRLAYEVIAEALGAEREAALVNDRSKRDVRIARLEESLRLAEESMLAFGCCNKALAAVRKALGKLEEKS